MRPCRYRNKYPDPNLTLQAGSIEKNESPLRAAIRETLEESRFCVHANALKPQPIRLLGGGLMMYVCEITSNTRIYNNRNTVYVGDWGD